MLRLVGPQLAFDDVEQKVLHCFYYGAFHVGMFEINIANLFYVVGRIAKIFVPFFAISAGRL